MVCGWKRIALILLIGILSAGSACNCISTDRPGKLGDKRPTKYAQKIENPHLENFHKVSDDLYRGAQPGEEGMKELEKLGMKTVINLREFHSDRDELEGVKMKSIHIKLEAHDEPEERDVVTFLSILKDRENLPAFVHCKHGADRTGMMVAIYRIVFQNWDREEAIKEWTTGGFGYHDLFEDIIRFVREADFEKLKKEAGIK
ncbi:MAG: fused DSP-PTPase phosphatase/NAD kinase-like protein [Planctomycetota bacterium]|jgi:protein tyrosine/serine phosphatase